MRRIQPGGSQVMCQHVVKPPESKHRLRLRPFTASSLTRASLSPLRPCRCRRLQPQTIQKDTPSSVDAQTASRILICPNHPQTVRPTTPSPQPISRREAPEPAPPAEKARTGAKAARLLVVVARSVVLHAYSKSQRRRILRLCRTRA